MTMTRRRLLPAFALAGAAILAAGCSRRPGPADTIYFGGPILTMVGEAPAYVEAVAVEDGRIVFTGTKAEALELAGPATSLRDLRGMAMLPGFIDAHSHFMFALNMVNQVNVAGPPVGPCIDIPSVIAALKAHGAAARIPEGGWIIGWGYDPEQLAERRHIRKFGDSLQLPPAPPRRSPPLQRNWLAVPEFSYGDDFPRRRTRSPQLRA